MTTNEIKKELYREKPMAAFRFANKTGLLYETTLFSYTDREKRITFIIPLNDIGDATFTDLMGAQLLIRYLVQSEEVVGNSLGKKDIYIDGDLTGSQG